MKQVEFTLKSIALCCLVILLTSGLAPQKRLLAETRFSTRSAVAVYAIYDQPRVENGPPPKNETKQEKQADSENMDAFRHSPSVTGFANRLHLDIETTARLFEYLNFGIVIVAIGIPLFKLLPKMLRKRSDTLSHELQSARAATESANARLSAIEAKFAGLDAEISAIKKQVEEDMRNDEVRIKASIEEETQRVIAGAEHEIGIAAQQAQRGLKQYAAELAIDRAMSQLTLDQDTDSALIAEFANGSQLGSRGGKN